MNSTRIDDLREAALDRVDRSQKTARNFLIAGGTAEAVLVITLLFLIDFDQTTHLVIFFGACLVYVPLAFGMFALRAHIDLSTQRVLAAVALEDE